MPPDTAQVHVLDELGTRKTHVDRLRPISVAEMRAASPPHWLVRDVAHAKSLILVWGASGSGKTFLVLDLAISIARGQRWFGHRVRQGGVVYIAGEGHLRFRLDAYCKQHEVDDADLAAMRVLSTNINLLDVDADILPLLVALQETAANMGGVGLVVLDTLNAMMSGGDENSSEDMGRMIAAARKIMGALDCAVIFVHHGGKDETRGARGHSSLKAALDTEVYVKDSGGERVATVEKVRDGETGAAMGFRLLAVDLGPSADPDADDSERESSCVVEPSEVAKAVKPAKLPRGAELAYRALRETLSDYGDVMPATSAINAGTRAVPGNRWRQAYYVIDALDPAGDEPKERDARKKRFDRARLALLNGGSVQCVNDLYWIPK